MIGTREAAERAAEAEPWRYEVSDLFTKHRLDGRIWKLAGLNQHQIDTMAEKGVQLVPVRMGNIIGVPDGDYWITKELAAEFERLRTTCNTGLMSRREKIERSDK